MTKKNHIISSLFIEYRQLNAMSRIEEQREHFFIDIVSKNPLFSTENFTKSIKLANISKNKFTKELLWEKQ